MSYKYILSHLETKGQAIDAQYPQKAGTNDP